MAGMDRQEGGGGVGPLRGCEENPRYFADGSGRAVYLTGSHTWSNLKDMGGEDPPAAFDFDAYLDFLGRIICRGDRRTVRR